MQTDKKRASASRLHFTNRIWHNLDGDGTVLNRKPGKVECDLGTSALSLRPRSDVFCNVSREFSMPKHGTQENISYP